MQRNSGFTLIEVMVTVAIVAILAAIAIPNYANYIVRSKIQEATSNLLAMRTKMELYFQDNRTFVGACAPGTVAPLPSGLKYFDITCPAANLTATTYVVQAKGKTATDLEPLVLTINEANVRHTVAVPPGWVLPSTNCWVAKKGGDC
jgi:type IV pilus assembly protein PilE